MWINICNVENFRALFGESFPHIDFPAFKHCFYGKSGKSFFVKELADVFKTDVYPHQGILQQFVFKGVQTTIFVFD